MNRREFTALIAGGFLFPRDLLSAMAEPQLPAEYPDGPVIYFRRSAVGTEPGYGHRMSHIYELWQPGIVLGVGYLGGHLRQVEKPFHVELHSPGRCATEFGGCGICYTMESMDIVSAFRKCVPHGMVVVDGDVNPYRAVGALGRWHAASSTPLLLRHEQAVSLVGAGDLEYIEPKYTHKEYMELCHERKRRAN